MKIAVLDDYADAFRKTPTFPRLNGHDVVVYRDTPKDPATLVARLHDAHAVVLTQTRSRFPRALIEQLPALRLIAQTGSHHVHIDIAACTERGIVVCTGGGGTANSTAELTWGLIIAAMRNICGEVAALRGGAWQSTIGTQLHGKTLGVYGLGRIGRAVAAVGHAFGMRVTCWGRATTIKLAREAAYSVPDSRHEFFAGADIVTLHIRNTPETRGIVTASDLASMKTDGLLVNTSRAGLIEDGALIAALHQGRPGFAAVDVYEDEPVLGTSHPLLTMPNVLCTPHLGYAVRENYAAFYGAAVDNVVAFAAGCPINMLNPEAMVGHPIL